MSEQFETICLNLAKEYKDIPNAYFPFKDISSRDCWNQLSPELKALLITDGEAALNKPYPIISASHFMAFRQNGNRVDFESVYFERRHMLNSLVLAECIENKGRFLQKIVDGIWHIVEESSWVLPAHNSYSRNSGPLILPDVNRPVLDLFSCETGAMLSMVLFLLRPALDGISPIIGNRVESELKKRIIIPYLTEHFWWMGNHDEPMCNWTPWCTQNVLLTVFTNPRLTDASEKTKILHQAAYSLDCFLKDYGEDGCCDEGAQYYRHAGLCLYACLDILNAITDRHFCSVYSVQKVKNIAAYISMVHVSGPWYFNFADCSAKAGRTGVREYLFGKATGQDFLVDFATNDFAADFTDRTIFNDESQQLNLYYRTQTVFTAAEVLGYIRLHSTGAELTPPDTFYKSTGLWVCRRAGLAVAVKAGDNNDSHNHNDVGSITLFKNGRPILVDIGVGTYTAKTFSANRYDIPTMQSCYHNTPTINRLDQLPGERYCATNVELEYCEPDKANKSISMNIESAYPEELAAGYYRRTVTVEEKSTDSHKKTGTITIDDRFSYHDVFLNFITYEEPEIEGNTVHIGNAAMVISGAADSLIKIHKEVFPITDARLKTAWDHDLYRLQIGIERDVRIQIS